MATVEVIVCMLMAAALLSLSEGQQQCACGSADDIMDYRSCLGETILSNKNNENKNSYLCERYVPDDFSCKFVSPADTQVNSLFFDLRDNYKVYRLFSRNFHDTSCCYPPRIFCLYNVECEQGEILSYRIIRSDLRAKHEISTEPGRCSDRLTIDFGRTGREIVTCGRNTSLEREGKPEPEVPSGNRNSKLTVNFHSSPHCHNCGFFMFVSCVNMDNTYNQPNCENIPDIEKREVKKNPATTENFWNRFGKRSSSFKSFRCEVPVGATITYANKILTITKMNKVWKKFKNIWLFRVYDKVLREFTDMYGSSEITYNGYGILTVGDGIVQYIQSGVEPRLSPTPAEDEVISLLLGALLDRVPRFAEDRLNFSGIIPPNAGSPGGPDSDTCPTDPSKGRNTCLFVGPDVIGKRSTVNLVECAERASRSCNGIVRSIGDYFLSLIPRL